MLASDTATGWKTLSVVATPPVGAAGFQVHINSRSNSGTAYFDSVTLSN